MATPHGHQPRAWGRCLDLSPSPHSLPSSQPDFFCSPDCLIPVGSFSLQGGGLQGQLQLQDQMGPYLILSLPAGRPRAGLILSEPLFLHL